ncbi:hypothetical protein D3C81_1408970 [compost metagenome]
MPELGLLRFQELSARRRVEVEMLHVDRGADPARRRLHGAGIGTDLRGMGIGRGAAGQRKLGD